MYDTWLSALLGSQPGTALMAVGGLGRREPSPYGDLDLVLLHDGTVTDIGTVAERLWYPIWDSGVGLDHSVRTPDQALEVSGSDLKAALGLLDSRHIGGDATLTAFVRERATERWLRDGPRRLPELQELARSRWARRGDAAFLLEPDLKDSRGGLRDWVGLRALASAQLLDLTPAVVQASTTLLDVRAELHRGTGRAVDVLRGQDRAGIAAALTLTGRNDLDGPDTLLHMVNLAARTISFATDAAWRRVAGSSSWAGVTAGAGAAEGASWSRRLRRRVYPSGPDPRREPLAAGVVAQGGEVVLARDCEPGSDPALPLRVARAAAQQDLPISDYTLHRLADETAPMPVPWPAQARSEFVTILGTGARCVAALEALDQVGLLSRLIPQWEFVRGRAQHNPVHKFTVDRHLIETAVQVTAFAQEVDRPDLLLTAAFLHDIGKGHPGDHSIVGAELTSDIATRMGFSNPDVVLLSQATLHHLLLPDTATRRDLDDPSTIAGVIAAIGDGLQTLQLLHYLSIADALATGPAAWSDWKAGLVQRLVAKTRAVLTGAPMPPAPPDPPHLLALAATGSPRVLIEGDQVSVLAPARGNLLSQTAGLLALHSLDVRSAELATMVGMSVHTFVVSPRFGHFPDPELLQSEFSRVLAGTLEVGPKLRERAAKYDPSPAPAPIRLNWLDNAATGASVLEVRGPDRIGLLYAVAEALEVSSVGVRSARISSLGGFVVDAFYVTDRNVTDDNVTDHNVTDHIADDDAQPLTPQRQSEVSERVLRALMPTGASEPSQDPSS